MDVKSDVLDPSVGSDLDASIDIKYEPLNISLEDEMGAQLLVEVKKELVEDMTELPEFLQVKEESVDTSTSEKNCRDSGTNKFPMEAVFVRVEAEECRSKWKNLRDTYMRIKKTSKGKSGDAASIKKPWQYFKMLSFLDSSLEPANTSTSIPDWLSGNIEELESCYSPARPTSPEANVEIEVTRVTPSTSPSVSGEIQHGASKLSNKGFPGKRKMDDIDRQLLEIIGRPEKKLCTEELFCKSLAEDMLTLPPDKRDFFKVKVQELFFNIKYDHIEKLL